jgi:membrane fusion protein, multidrug efflux system
MRSIFRQPGLFLILLILVSACNSGKSSKTDEPKRMSTVPVVEGFIVKPGLLDQSITVSGSLKAFEETVLMPDISGRVVKVNLPEGKYVTKGTLLVKLFDADMQATLKKLQTQLEISKQTLKRQEELLKVEGISQLEVDQTRLQATSVEDDISVLLAQLSKTEVVAPFDGVVGLRNISVGAQVTPNTPLATIREVNRLKLDFSVPEKYSREIITGKTVQFTVQGMDTSFNARILAEEGGIEQSTRNLRVRAVVDQAGLRLDPGTFAKVVIPLAIIPDALMIPTQSVIPQERNKKVIVAREGKAVFTTIITGTRRPTDIEVTEGLKAGDTIVTTGLLFLKPDDRLKFSRVR